MSTQDTFTIRCPDCGADMKIDAATGKILSHESAQKTVPEKDFDSLLAGLDKSKSRADEIFQQEFKALEDKDRLMEEKFKAAFERAKDEDDGKPPVRPWDLD